MGGWGAEGDVTVVSNMDGILLDRDRVWDALRPKSVLQLEGRITSKRLAQFLEWSALPSAAGAG